VLVLGRRVGQKIFIPRYGIEIEVVSIRPDKVKLGFTAPGDVVIVRDDCKSNAPRVLTEGFYECEHSIKGSCEGVPPG
jgi:carbon storage regulator CsrA